MRTTYDLLSEALKPIEEWALTAKDGERYSNPTGNRTTNLRLDAEFPATDRTQPQVNYGMFAQFRDELMDVLTYGDVTNRTDPIRSCFDGEIKRNAHLKKIEITSAALYREFRPVRQSWEYTLFLVVYVEFD